VRNDQGVVLELEFLPPSVVAINQYTIPMSGGAVFVGRRSIPDPFTSAESLRSVIEFRHGSGDAQTFVNCSFRAVLGLNLCMADGKLIMKNQLVQAVPHSEL
jgi:hypothetical protein